MTSRHPVPALLAAFLVTGCAQFRGATEPSDGPRARLRILGKDTIVELTPGKACHDNGPGSGVVLSNGLGSHGFRGRSLGMPGEVKDKGHAAELYVEAGKPVSLVFMKGNDANQLGCQVSVSFVPEEGKDYEASVSLVKLQETMCVASVISLGSREKVAYVGAPPCE